ncbi:homogentisate 1,2-dioxygenase [Variovorax sp. DAIF25]|uniref:homogentisate 1,2-dioxygenase n=1 Tax=Variovorax sp. DAIF25 TaxID=3080983 RepID=UPI003D6C0B7D
MNKPIVLPMRAGIASRQAHADIPPGTYEREIGREGFGGQATHMYHRHAPTAWLRWDGPHRPRAYDLNQLPAAAQGLDGALDCPLDAPLVAGNAHMRLRCWKPSAPMRHLARNADGDELLFVHEGGGDLYCDYGHLRLRDGDYLLLPRGTAWRYEPAAPSFLLLLEATGDSFRLPERGLLGEHALFDAGVLDVPQLDEAFVAQQHAARREWAVRIQARHRVSTLTYPHDPLDALGWKGTLAPVRLNWRDIRPVLSARYHLPPSAHTTFLTQRVAVCTFCPRPAETDPGALKVPFFHSNDDYDELLFLHAGRFFSRDGMGPGAMTFHPAGFPHGPHPAVYRNSLSAPRTELHEVAINIDARDPLDIGPGMAAFERAEHADSWRGYLDAPEDKTEQVTA